MRFESVDRPPNFELGYWGQTIERWLSEGMPTDQIDSLKEEKANEYFGLDGRPSLPLALLTLPRFEKRVIEETERYVVYRDENGILRRALKEGTVRGTRPSMDQYIDFPVKTREDFKEIIKRYDPLNPERYPKNWYAVVSNFRKGDEPLCLDQPGTLGFFSMARLWMGTERALKSFYRNPQLMHEMMDFIADYICAVIHKALHEAPVDYFMFFEDFACKSGPLVSPLIFRQFMLEEYKRVTKFLRDHGITTIWFDSDGNIEVLIPLLIEAGVTCILPLEAAAEMDPGEIRREYGHALALVGGIDKREISKDKEAIEREVMNKAAVVADGGYIPTLDHSFPPDIPYDNFRYYLKVKNKMIKGE